MNPLHDVARRLQQRIPVPVVASPFEAFAIAVNLAADSAVVCVLERATVITEKLQQDTPYEFPRFARTSKKIFDLRHLHRLPGAEYPEVIRVVSALMKSLPTARMPPALVVNVTHVGKPVVVLMTKSALRPIAVTIADGAAEHRVASNEFRVPAKDLIGTLAVLLQSDRFKISADLTETEALTSELARLNYGEDDWKESNSNGLSLAVCLAAWWRERMMPTPQIKFSLAR